MFHLIVGIISYFSTTAIGGAPLFAIVVVIALVASKIRLSVPSLAFIVGSLLFSLGSYISYAAGVRLEGDVISGEFALIPLPLAILLGYFSSSIVNKRFIDTILLCIFIEILVGWVEYFLGIRSLIGVDAAASMGFGDSDLLYLNKVYGLSLNSSAFAFKILFSIVAIFYLKHLHSVRMFHNILLIASFSSFYINFTRTAVVASAIACLLYFSLQKKWVAVYVGSLFIGVLAAISMAEFTRNGEGIDLSGREQIFPLMLDFLSAKPFFGNYGFKYYVTIGGNSYHAHNSFLQVLVTSGFTYAAFLTIFVIYLAGRQMRQFVLILPLLIFSCFQYGVFWGGSLYDQLFWAFLIGLPASYVKSKSTVQKDLGVLQRGKF